jgi:hypothetical protein
LCGPSSASNIRRFQARMPASEQRHAQTRRTQVGIGVRNAKTGPKHYLLSNGQGLSLAHTSERRKDLATPISSPRHVKENLISLRLDRWRRAVMPTALRGTVRIGMARCALVDEPALRSAHPTTPHYTTPVTMPWVGQGTQQFRVEKFFIAPNARSMPDTTGFIDEFIRSFHLVIGCCHPLHHSERRQGQQATSA